jgi:hypothetical protein
MARTPFQRAVVARFAPIGADHGAVLKSACADAYGEYVLFCNDVAGFRVSWEYREGGLLVYLVQLLPNGKLPSFLQWDTPEDRAYWFPIEDLAAIHGEATTELSYDRLALKPKIKEIAPAIDYYAELVATHASGFLEGDFSEIPALLKRQDARGRQRRS